MAQWRKDFGVTGVSFGEGTVRDEAGDVSRSQRSGHHCKDLELYPQWEAMQGASASGRH